MARGDPETLVLEALRPALEEAVAFARRQASEQGLAAVPMAMRPLLKLQRLTPAALRGARAALESDEEFRGAVAAQVEPPDASDLPWAWLARAPGWDEQLERVVLGVVEADRVDRHERAERSAARRLQQVEAKQRATEESLARARRELDRLRARLVAADQEAGAAAAELEGLRSALASQTDLASRSAARAQRAEESLGAERVARRAQLQELESLRAEVDRLTAGTRADAGVDADQRPGTARGAAAEHGSGTQHRAGEGGRTASVAPAEEPDLAAVRAAVRRAAEALGLLAPEAAGPPAGGPARRAGPDAEPLGPGGSTDAAAGRAAAGRLLRRRPPRPGRGLHADTPEGVFELLRRPGVRVFVDGYNAAKQQWPNLDVDLQRERLVACVGELGARAGTVIDVVFDGADVTVWRRAGPGSPWVRTAFSPEGVEADDEIMRRVAALAEDTDVVVVSSDRRVQEGVGRLGAAVVRSELLGRLLG